MKLFSLLPIAAFGQFGDPAQMAQMVMPMIKQYFDGMDHEAHKADFEQDNNGLFESYFNYCDVAGDGVLTQQDDADCKARLYGFLEEKLASYNVALTDDQVAQMNQGVALFNSFGKQMFSELIDSNHDGSTTLDEIEFNAYCVFRASAKMMLQMMDRNHNGKLEKRGEFGMLNLDELLKAPGVAEARKYVPDLDKIAKQAKRAIRKADLNGDKAYDERELAKVMLDLTNVLVNRIFE